MFNTVEDVDQLAHVIRRRSADAASSRAVERMD